MKRISLVCFSIFCSILCSTVPTHAALNLIDSYDVSYIYNTLSSDASYSPTGTVEYSPGVFSTPLVIGLGAGNYQLKLASGRETGNLVDKTTFDAAVGGNLDDYWTNLVQANNPGAPKYESGFDGGNTNPSNFPNDWSSATAYWVGDSETSGNGDRIFNVGTTRDVTVDPGEKLWLFWNDNYSKDNLGGSTVELWQFSDDNTNNATVPEPATMLLFGAGAAAAIARRFKRA